MTRKNSARLLESVQQSKKAVSGRRTPSRKPHADGATVRGIHAVAPAGRSVFRDLFDPKEAAELEIRSILLQGLQSWLSDMTQTEAAGILRLTRKRISDVRRGKISQFSLDLLLRLGARAGLELSVDSVPPG